MERNDIEHFLRFAKSMGMSITAIELEAGLPKKTISHWLAGRRGLNDGHIERLIPVIERIKTSFELATING